MIPSPSLDQPAAAWACPHCGTEHVVLNTDRVSDRDMLDRRCAFCTGDHCVACPRGECELCGEETCLHCGEQVGGLWVCPACREAWHRLCCERDNQRAQRPSLPPIPTTPSVDAALRSIVSAATTTDRALAFYRLGAALSRSEAA